MSTKYEISESKTLLDALNTINVLGKNEALTLFVVDSNGGVLGTLTDGDIRRSLINGQTLETEVAQIAHKSFVYLNAELCDVKLIRTAKEKGIELLPVLNSQMQIVDVVNLKKLKSYLPIDAVLMAGGKGERLRPMTEKTPKPLLPMNGKPIIDYIVEHVLLYGIKNISVTVNYLKEQIEEHFSKPIEGIRINTVREPKFLGTIGSLQYVSDWKNDTILLMNSDAITDINLEDFYLHFKENNADMSVAAVPYTISVPYGILDLDGRAIKGIQEKPSFNYYANAGIYLFKRNLLELIPANTFFNATDLMDLAIRNNHNVISFPMNGTWIDIGNPQEYKKAIDLTKNI